MRYQNGEARASGMHTFPGQGPRIKEEFGTQALQSTVAGWRCLAPT